jgi:hypothetical protein
MFFIYLFIYLFVYIFIHSVTSAAWKNEAEWK